MRSDDLHLLPPKEAADIVSTGHALADAARAASLSHFRSARLGTDNKSADGFDPVTVADRAAEQAMRELLRARRPQDGIRGEEFGSQDGTSGLTWVLDPIDGTRAFISGAPVWGVLIALVGPDGPIFGIIDQPYIGERWCGGLGTAELVGPHGTQALRRRDTVALEGATLCSTFPEIGTVADREGFTRVAQQVRLVRYGLDCYAYGLLAAGQIDLVIEAGLNDYDICAPIAVIEAAGGIVTDWEGCPAWRGGRVLAAATPELHASALAALAEPA